MATIFEDNFNAYNNGDLNGQGSWSGDTSYDIQGTTVKEGAKAVQCVNNSSYDTIEKTGNLVNDGRITFYIRRSDSVATSAYYRLHEDTDTKIIVSMNKITDKIQYRNADGYVDIQSFSLDTWYCVEIEWRSSDHKARYRIDEGTWTDWDTTRHTWTSGIETFNMYAGNSNLSFFVDHIAEYPISEEENTTNFFKAF